jgi:hypothetical protein
VGAKSGLDVYGEEKISPMSVRNLDLLRHQGLERMSQMPRSL